MVSRLTTLSLLLVSTVLGSELAGSPELPFSFVENRGQARPEIRFTGQGPGFKAWFEAKSIVFQKGGASTRMTFVGGADRPVIVPTNPMGATINYFLGNQPDQWITDLKSYRSLRYRNVWRGIDVVYRADGPRTKTEYLVAPGASVKAIRLRFDGEVEVQPNGSLVVTGDEGKYEESAPVLYQGEASDPLPVAGRFRKNEDGTVGFETGSYDGRRPLVIDPLIVFSGYFGHAAQTTITAIAVNSYYNIVVAGWTMSASLPASGGAQSKYDGGVDAFVAGFSPAGGQLQFCTYLGGSADDRAFGIAVDSSNSIYVTGWTSSSNFPVSNPFQKKLNGTRDAFVAKMNASGSALTFSTYLGGSGSEAGYGIVVDSTGAPVIVGDSTSTNLPVTGGVFQSALAGTQNAFIAKLSTSGNALTFLTYFGGNGTDHGAAIKLDPSNSVFIGGSTYSTNLPVLNAFQPYNAGGQDGFLAKLSPGAVSLVFSTYYGGSGGSPGAPEEVNSITVPAGSGNLNVGGTTSSIDFPVTPGCLQPTFGGGATDGFLGRINGTTGAMKNSTYLGGSGDDSINAIDLDPFYRVYATGYTTSSDFPTRNPVQSSNLGGMDVFVVKMTFQSILWSTYLGGNGNDSGNAIAVDSLNNVVVAGSTGSSSFPVKGSVGFWPAVPLSSFLAKLAAPFTPAVTSVPTFIEDIWHNTGYNGSNITLQTSSFGLAGDIPIAGDWTGLGVKHAGTFRNGVWYLDINGDGFFGSGDKTVDFGQAGDIPVVGDWNGTGKIKLGLFRNGTFILDLSGHLSGISTGLSDLTFSFGSPGDVPVAADWNQSGTAKVGVFRNGLWLLDVTGTRIYASAQAYSYGQAGDVPLAGDWDGSGIPHLGIYRQGLWILDYGGYYSLLSPYSSYNFVFAFGGSPYLPLLM
jgi:hypothetical protein